MVIPLSVWPSAVCEPNMEFESSFDPGNLFLCLCCSLMADAWKRTYFYPRNNAGNMNRIYRRSRLEQVGGDSKVQDRHSVTHSS